MDVDHLRALLAISREGRITAAARALGLSQPGLSRRVQQLEREAGAKLVIRTARGLVLTDAGKRFLKHAERAVGAIEAGLTEVDELGGHPRGAVAIGTMPTISTYALPAVIAPFVARYPEVTIRLREGFPEELEELVARGDLDLAVVNLPMRRVDLAIRKLWQEDYVLAVPKKHRFARARGPIDLREIAGEPIVVVPSTPASRAIEAACEERGVQPRFVLEADNWESVRRMVERGLGVTLLPRLMLGGKRPRDFAAIDVGKGGIRRQVAVVHRGEGYLTAAARALRERIIEALAVSTGARRQESSEKTPRRGASSDAD